MLKNKLKICMALMPFVSAQNLDMQFKDEGYTLHFNATFGHIVSSVGVSRIPVGQYDIGFQGVLFQGGMSILGPYVTVGPDLKFGKVYINPFFSYNPVCADFFSMPDDYGLEGVMPGVGMRYQMSENHAVWLSLAFPAPIGIGFSKKI